MGSRWCTVVVDAMDPNRLARWWAEVLDFRLLREAAGEVVIGRDGSPSLLFTRAAHARSDKGRLHIELDPDDQDAELERLLDMGARHVGTGRPGPGQADPGQPDSGQGTRAACIVLADPEGNEFCVLSAAGR
jgi:catechol-2,3-dioxygenase